MFFGLRNYIFFSVSLEICEFRFVDFGGNCFFNASFSYLTVHILPYGEDMGLGESTKCIRPSVHSCRFFHYVFLNLIKCSF